jgi:dihydroorotase
VTDPSVDVFDREKIYIETVLKPIIETFSTLKIVMEHITTEEAVNFVLSCGPNVAATITVHHLLYNRNELFKGGICPHAYCLPILKREKHRVALLNAATSGSPKFFLGTDSAPHTIASKESSCGCAGSN